MLTNQFTLDLRYKQIGDLFAGGGGASCAIEMATGLYVDFAVNHDAQAILMHTINHPQTRHYQTDVYEVDPYSACNGRPIGLLHLSPDCTHHSQAAGGQPRDNIMYWSSRAGHFYLRIFILQWTHSIVGCMRPFKIVITNELRDFLFNSVFIHGRSVT